VTIDDVLERIRAQMNLEAETEYELLEEMRSHLEEAVADARARGMSEEEALAQASARFGVEEIGQELQATHEGWGALDAQQARLLGHRPYGAADPAVALPAPSLRPHLLDHLLGAVHHHHRRWRRALVRATTDGRNER
jgi:hypothetical protein